MIANFLERRGGEVHGVVKVRSEPVRAGQAPHKREGPTVGYYAPAAGSGAEKGLGHRGGAERRAASWEGVQRGPVMVGIIKAGVPSGSSGL